MTQHLMARLLMGCGESLRSALQPPGDTRLQQLRRLSGHTRCEAERQLSAFQPGAVRSS